MRSPSEQWSVRPVGDLALLIDEVAAPAALARNLEAAGLPTVDIVPAARTVLVTVADPAHLDDVHRALSTIDDGRTTDHDAGTVTIDVAYDGADLVDVADACGLPVDRVVELHAGATYRVEFCGFAPGFGYLSGLPPELHLPRRATPRTRVPSGAVAIASSYAAVYPTDSPGGWHLLGSTPAAMFDVDRTPPALLTPGTEVRFRPT